MQPGRGLTAMTQTPEARRTIPDLKTERLELRGVTVADIPAYTRHFVDYEVIRHLSSAVPWPYPEDGVRRWVLEHILPPQGIDRWTWGLFEPERPAELIGAIELWREGKPEHRGFWLGRSYWGRGYMTEAAAVVTEYAFDSLGFEELIFSNALGNERSRRIKEKTGAEFWKTAPAAFVDPTYDRQELWRLSAARWRAQRIR